MAAGARGDLKDRVIERLPHAIDIGTEQLLSIDLPEKQVREASFLDERVLTPDTRGRWMPIDTVRADERDDARWIFHIGHCGSTLLSRLLDAVPGALGLREPRSLRDLAEAYAVLDRPESLWDPVKLPQRARLVSRLLAQSVGPAELAIVKATSHVSELAPALVGQGARVALLYISPESYLETILAGENSRRALAGLSGARLVRLDRRLGGTPWRLWSLNEGQRIALGWVTEMTSLVAASKVFDPGSALWIDFDRFLNDPAPGLIRIAHHFGLTLDEPGAARIVGGPAMRRYSKAPEHPYDPALRQAARAEARSEHREAIRSAHAWLADAARAYPVIEEAVLRARDPECSS